MVRSLTRHHVLATILLGGLISICACTNSSSMKGGASKGGQNSQGKGKGKGENSGNPASSADSTSGDTGDTDETNGGNPNGPGGRPGTDDSNAGITKDNLPDGRLRLTFRGEVTQKSVPTDIIFALDTSGSMGEEKAQMETNMQTFLAKLTSTAKDLDYRVWVIAEAFRFDKLDPAKQELINKKVESTDALEILKKFVEGTLTPLKLSMRDNSRKQFVVITDDNAGGVVAKDFLALEASTPLLKGMTSFNGVIGVTAGNNSTTGTKCNIAEIGSEYKILAESNQTRGLIQDICASDWSKLLENLAMKISAESRVLTFVLDKTRPPASAASLSVEVAGKAVPASGYTYDASQNTLTLTPDTAPKSGELLVVTYRPKA